MVVDSSAMKAILFDGGEADRLLEALVADAARRMSSATWLEIAILGEERGGRGQRRT